MAAWEHAEQHGARAMEHGAWGMVQCSMVHTAQGMVYKAHCTGHGWCTGQGAWCMGHGAKGMGHVAQGMVHVQGVTNHGSQGMLHGSMIYRTFSPLFTVSEITDALPHPPSASMPLISETHSPSTSLPLKSEASGVSVFRDASQIS